MGKIHRLLWSLLAVWLCAVTLLSSFHIFEGGSRYATRTPWPLGVAVLAPVLIFAVWYRASASFRGFVLGLNPVVLTAVQSWRVVGIVFLILLANGMLPSAFALPAGLGDMAIGITAPFVALAMAKRQRKPTGLYVFWQYAGMTDLIVAVGTGVLLSGLAGLLFSKGGVTTRLMSVLPLSLIPTFFVPLFFILHMICLAQARKAASDKELLSSIPLTSQAARRPA